MDNNSLSHTTWNCKYHIVFAPKYVLKQDVKFMNLIASTLAAKLGIAANGESVSASLKDRILNHLEDEKIVAKCGKGTYWLL